MAWAQMNTYGHGVAWSVPRTRSLYHNGDVELGKSSWGCPRAVFELRNRVLVRTCRNTVRRREGAISLPLGATGQP